MTEQSTDVVQQPEAEDIQIKLPDYVVRMRDELRELDEKTTKLAQFLASDEVRHVNEAERILMVQQMFSMRNYLFFLDQRFNLVVQDLMRQHQEHAGA